MIDQRPSGSLTTTRDNPPTRFIASDCVEIVTITKTSDRAKSGTFSTSAARREIAEYRGGRHVTAGASPAIRLSGHPSSSRSSTGSVTSVAFASRLVVIAAATAA